MSEKGAEAARNGRRAGRVLSVFKALVLLALLGVTGYGMVHEGLYGDELWLPVASGLLALLFITLFPRDFFRDVPVEGWVLVALLAVLVGVKGVSMVWTVSEGETIKEVLRSSMYAATFLLALAALSAGRQVGPAMDAAILITGAVAGYGLLQKIRPLDYPVTSLDGVRVGSTLDYANTTAMVVGVGIVLALARLGAARNPLARGLYAAAIVAFAASIYLTASRGGIATLALGVVVLLLLSSDRLQAAGNLILLAIPGGLLLVGLRNTDALLRSGVTDEARVAAGEQLLVLVVAAAVGAFAVQAIFGLAMARYELMPLGRRVVGGVLLGLAALVVVGSVVAVLVRFGGVGETYEALMSQPERTEDLAQRLASPDLGFRDDYWRVAWDEWMRNPLTGTGAGTFQFTWQENRPEATGVKQVHNLYLEQGTETGLVAFLALAGFAGTLVFVLARAALRSRPAGEGVRRDLLAGFAAAAVVYLSSSFLEWHWYIPPSTLLFMVLAGVGVKLAARTDWDLEERPEWDREAGGTRPGGKRA